MLSKTRKNLEAFIVVGCQFDVANGSGFYVFKKKFHCSEIKVHYSENKTISSF